MKTTSNVRHNITNQGWETVLHSIPKFRSKPEDKHYYKIPDKILIHPSFFSGQISDKLFENHNIIDMMPHTFQYISKYHFKTGICKDYFTVKHLNFSKTSLAAASGGAFDMW